jgi:hypothetical protein
MRPISARAVSMMIGIAEVFGSPRTAADFDAVNLRQHQIEHDEIRRFAAIVARASRPDALRSGVKPLCRDSGRQVPQCRIVFDDQDAVIAPILPAMDMVEPGRGTTTGSKRN